MKTTTNTLTAAQRRELRAYMVRMAVEDIEIYGESIPTRVAEYALIEYGDAMQLDDGELAPVWELALVAVDVAEKRLGIH